jgi:hypothetical protein
MDASNTSCLNYNGCETVRSLEPGKKFSRKLIRARATNQYHAKAIETGIETKIKCTVSHNGTMVKMEFEPFLNAMIKANPQLQACGVTREDIDAGLTGTRIALAMTQDAAKWTEISGYLAAGLKFPDQFFTKTIRDSKIRNKNANIICKDCSSSSAVEDGNEIVIVDLDIDNYDPADPYHDEYVEVMKGVQSIESLALMALLWGPDNKYNNTL